MDMFDLENLPPYYHPHRYETSYRYTYDEDFRLESIRFRFRDEPHFRLADALRLIETLPEYKYLYGTHSFSLRTNADFYARYSDIRELLYLLSDFETSEFFVNNESISPIQYLEMEHILLQRIKNAGH